MKKILFGSLVMLSMTSYAQVVDSTPACGQSRIYIQIKKDVSGIVDAINPLNQKYLTSDGQLNEILDALSYPNDNYISSKIVRNIGDFEEQVVNVGELSTHYSDLVIKSLKECIKIEQILKDINNLEQIKVSLPFYRSLAKAIDEEILLQETNFKTISEDLKKLLTVPTQDLLIKYGYSEDALAKDAIANASNDLDFVQRLLVVLRELNEDVPQVDQTIVTKTDNVIDQLYKAIELSVSSDQAGAH